MSIQQTIEGKLSAALSPEHLEVLNESHMHNVPPGSESHFKVTVVTAQFEGQRLVARHRTVNELLAEALCMHSPCIRSRRMNTSSARAESPTRPCVTAVARVRRLRPAGWENG